MKSFFSSRLSKFNGLITLCIVGVNTFSGSAMATPVRDVQDEVMKRGMLSEDVNRAMKNDFGFPNSAFPYYEPPNGCSNPLPTVGGRSSNRVFKSACDGHDRCYATPGESKSTCDSQFLDEMLKICESRSELTCSAEARTMYSAVWSAGASAYNSAQKEQRSYIQSVLGWLRSAGTVFRTNSRISTDILIKSGDRIRIRASGTVQFGSIAGSGGPNGIGGNRIYNYFRNVPHGYLLARFRQPGMGNWEGWSPIGVGWDGLREVKPSAPGVLEFLVNDNDPNNNTGGFSIEVTIYSGKQ